MKKNEIYDLKYYISGYIYPRLVAFKEKVDTKGAESIPILKSEDPSLRENISFEEKENIWSKILEEMIFPFDYNCNPDKYRKLGIDEITRRMEKGLSLFSQYFDDLWI